MAHFTKAMLAIAVILAVASMANSSYQSSEKSFGKRLGFAIERVKSAR